MTQRSLLPFTQIQSTAPGFSAVCDNTSQTFALESTGLREWEGPGGRVVRVASLTAAPCQYALGDSNIVANSSESLLLPGHPAVTYIHPIGPNAATHIAVISSTTVTVNFGIGYGGAGQ